MDTSATEKPKNNNLNLGVRVSPAERVLLERAAALLDRPVAWLLRTSALKQANSLLNRVEQNNPKRAA